MTDSLFELFSKFVGGGGGSKHDKDEDHSVVIAAVALLLEVSRSDSGTDQIEERLIRKVLCDRFDVEEALVSSLIETGNRKVEDANDLFQFTQLINQHYSPQQKQQLIHAMWLVALADGKIQAIEDHIIRRVAGLIHVAHKDFIRLKLRAREAR